MSDLKSASVLHAMILDRFPNRDPDGIRDAILNIITRAPSAERRATGEWKRPPYVPPCSVKYACSACGGIAYYNHGSNNKKIKNGESMICRYRFCPHCGAEMRGDKNETD